MVCGKCEKKLSKVGVLRHGESFASVASGPAFLIAYMRTQVACPDKWKDGANNTNESGGRKINENKLLSRKKTWQPYSAKCTKCKSNLPAGYSLCQPCAYRDGVCAMCGKKILDTSRYRQSNA